MLRLRPVRQRVDFLPGDTAEGLRSLPGDAKLEVVLSNHLVRYAVLPWTPALASEDEWMAYARHIFATTYGAESANWRIRICDGGRGKSRVACAIDATLLDSISAIDRVVSIQPYLVEAFNARRDEFGKEPGWFVLHEPGRVTLALLADGEWKLLCNRQAAADWRDRLEDQLHRETASRGVEACRRVVLTSGMVRT